MKRMCCTRGYVVCDLMCLQMCVAFDKFCVRVVHFTRMDAQRRGGESWALTWMWNQYVILVGVGRLRDEFCLHFSSSRPEKGPKKSPKKSQKRRQREGTMVQNSLLVGHWIIHFPMSLRVKEWASEQENECMSTVECTSKASSVEQVNEWANEWLSAAKHARQANM